MRLVEFWPDYGGALLWTEAGERLELDSVVVPEILRHEGARWIERYDDSKLPWEQRGTSLGDAYPPDGRDEVESRPDGSFRVVLSSRRGAPQRHHRIADELLDPATVALDDLGHGREVAGLQLPDLLRVPSLGDRGEIHQVGEEHGHEATLGLG